MLPNQLYNKRYRDLYSQEIQEKKIYNPKQLKKTAIGTNISIITLNANRLNAPIKRHRLAEWIKKTRPIYKLSTRNPFQI